MALRSTRRSLTAVALMITAVSVAAIEPAIATYPGAVGRIAFAAFVPSIGHEQIFTIEPDGTDRTMLTHSANADRRFPSAADRYSNSSASISCVSNSNSEPRAFTQKMSEFLI
jgi:hypothetical protein